MDEKVSCLNCYHFPVCGLWQNSREKILEDAEKAYQDEAESCDFYEPVRKE